MCRSGMGIGLIGGWEVARGGFGGGVWICNAMPTRWLINVESNIL